MFGGPLDSVFPPIFKKHFAPVAAENLSKLLGGSTPPDRKNTH
jgi:hypothetical protein